MVQFPGPGFGLQMLVDLPENAMLLSRKTRAAARKSGIFALRLFKIRSQVKSIQENFGQKWFLKNDRF